MPLSEIPKYLGPETRKLVEAALEDAWDELSKDGHFEPTPARKKLTSTMVALASVGETDHRKLKWFAIHACRGAMQAEQSAAAQRAHELAKRQLNRPQNLRFLFGLVVFGSAWVSIWVTGAKCPKPHERSTLSDRQPR